MKKIFAILMALCMFCGVAMAEAATELNWDEIAPIIEQSGVAGDFVTFDEIAVKIWIPSDLQPAELTDEDRSNGFIGYFADAEQTASLSVVYVDVSGMSIEDYTAQLNEMEGVAEIEAGTVNGLPCVSYTMPEQDSGHIAFATEAGYILEVSVWPASAEGADLVWGIVLGSIQAE